MAAIKNTFGLQKGANGSESGKLFQLDALSALVSRLSSTSAFLTQHLWKLTGH